jgi:HEAT repeat protein
VAELSSGGEKAGQAAQLLATLGAPAVTALQQAWPKLDAAGRLRATHVFGLSSEADANARQMLSTALDDPSEEVVKAATAALLGAGPRSRAMLLPRLSRSDRSADELAISLARRQPAESIDALLAALAAKGGSDREAIRRAIALACQHGGQGTLDRVRAWSQSDAVGVSARAALALALSRAQSGLDARPLAAEIAAAAAPHASEFPDLWRLVQAARALPGGEPLDSWLAKIASSDQRWMLRAAAITALSERSAAQLQDAARAALKDEYPRVRVAAIDAIGSRADVVDLLSTHATRDTWPMVRVAAVDALAGIPGTAPVLRSTLNDSARLVRAAGIRALARIKQRDAWPLVKAHLEDPEEWREVLLEAAAFAGALCEQDARNALVGFLRKGVEPEANTRATELGMAALDALRRLGGEAEHTALSLARSAVAFRAASEQPLPAGAACQQASAAR